MHFARPNVLLVCKWECKSSIEIFACKLLYIFFINISTKDFKSILSLDLNFVYNHGIIVLNKVIRIKTFTFNPFQENTYLLFDETTECIVIDPGCYENYEQRELEEFVYQNGLKVVKVINTHCHVDHVVGNSFVKAKYKVKLSIPKLEDQIFRAVKAYAPNYGFFKYEEAEVNEYIELNQRISFGNSFLETLFVPGHSPGHLAFYHPHQNFLISGDVLFNGSIGRTDLPLGDYDTLIESIKSKVYTLPDNTTVFPGHGPETTIGIEKRSNPFIRG